MRRSILITFFSAIYFLGHTQSTTDPTQGNINVNTPKTPESAGFEKFGKYDVNEFTGSANIAIPLYTLTSRHLSAPITLSYHPNGIRVNEEASWVGLGWDLIAGGRITVETKGSVDFATGSVRGNAPSNTANEMQRIFSHLGGCGELAIATFASIIEPDNGNSTADTSLDITAGVQDMTEFGTGEPDVFRANFMGHSFNFYFDKITGAINFIGERTLFNITPQFDGPHSNILGWAIVDNEGIEYDFNQTELSTNTNASTPVVPPTTVTAWLLTKIVHPDGDYVQFTYANYGLTVPAINMAGAVTYLATSSVTPEQDSYQYPVLQSPQYLTKIETPGTAVNFALATRTDLYGPGSRELSGITVTDKTTSTVVKTVNFSYSYFQGTAGAVTQAYLNGLDYFLPTPLSQSAYLACDAQRLRLDSVSVNLGTYQPPYRFTYSSLAVPDKYSTSQDHWGYYNGVLNGNHFTGLIPMGGSFNVAAAVNSISPSVWNASGAVLGSSRDCNPNAMQTMTLQSITFPTGGSTSFVYEPHQSTMAPTIPVTGGGLRIKTIYDYSTAGDLLGTRNYTYGGGKYMGTIQYATTLVQIPSCTGNPTWQSTINFTSMGARNDNDILIGYAYITITETDPSGNANGSLTKLFNINTPSSSYSYNGAGITTAVPYCTPAWQAAGSCSLDPGLNPWSVTNNVGPIDAYLEPTKKGFAPTPSANLEGKLMQEQYFDNSNTLLKSVNYYYHLGGYSNQFYSVRAIQNRVGGFNISCGFPDDVNNGNRPFIFFISPAKSYFTLKDSVVETDYNGANSIRKKTAYQYNASYQPMFESFYNSDGTQTIHYMRTAAEIKPPQAAPASGLIATQMFQIANQHAIDLPVEQIVIHRGLAGDSSVISSRFNVYNNTLPLQVYQMESSTPLTFGSQFTPWSWALNGGVSTSTTIDSHYTMYTSADYSSSSLIQTLHTLQGNKAYIWDEGYNTLLAECSNTDISNVAFTSFETNAQGQWNYSSSGVILDGTAPTGNKVFNLATGNITLSSGITATRKYIVSYWSNISTPYSVTGSVSVTKGKQIGNYTYFEHQVTGTASVTLSGAWAIDELRLYPADAQMTTYTYFPLIGIGTKCDANNRVTYYSYDPIGRLGWIKDQDKNIIKTFQYHFSGLPGTQF